MFSTGNLQGVTAHRYVIIGSGNTAGTTPWITWSLPVEAKFVAMWCVGSGGGGGGGFSAATSTVKSGGGGGGSATCASAIYPASALPNTLYISCSGGGAGGGAGAAGTAGQNSEICAYPTTAVPSICFLRSGTAAAGGGAAGAASGAAAGGTAGTAATASLFYMSSMAFSVNVNAVAQAGGAGGNSTGPTAGANVTCLSFQTIGCGGAGGGAANAANAQSVGGNIVLPATTNIFWTNSTTLLPGGAVTVAGKDGHTNLDINKIQTYSDWVPTYAYGGSGAGGTASAVGVKGGNGSIGSGGGGGGAGTTGGAGGNGGPGAVIIDWW